MLGEKIKKLRKSLGFTQLQLAEKLGITQQEVSNIERNKRKRFSHEEIISFSDALGVPSSELLKEKDKQPHAV